MSRSPVLGTLAAAALIVLSALPLRVEGAEARAARPNVLVILCDDLGYGDLGCFGHPTIRTPNLDRLAAQGMRLTSYYAAAPVCSPSRAGLLTGRTPSRAGIYDWISQGHPMHLGRNEVTVATLLKRAGYATCHAGKWHLNGKFNSSEQPQPGDHGFDHWFSTQNNAAPSHENPTNFVRDGRRVGPRQGYSCQVVVDEAIDWLGSRGNPERPFFLDVCFHEPHENVAAPPDLVATYSRGSKRGQDIYDAAVTNMDAAVGRLLGALDAKGLAENTLVLFTSDNGPETLNRYPEAWRSHGSAGPLRGMKLDLHEGGIRVPAIIRWPGQTRPGQVVDEPVCGVDLLPTLCAIAGIAVPDDRPIDGASLLPVFEGKPVERRLPLFWHYFRGADGGKAALREGDWKLIAHWDGPELAPGTGLHPGDMATIKGAKLTDFELYNLRDDPGETRDRAAQEPRRVADMAARLRARYAEVVAEGRVWDVPPAPAPKAKAAAKAGNDD
jgi:arylsulfatase A